MQTNNLTTSNLHKENTNLSHTNQKLTDEIFDLQDELDEQKDLKTSQPAKVVTENKNKNKKNNTNSFAPLEGQDDDDRFEQGDIDVENKSYPSVTQTSKTDPKSSSKTFTTPANSRIPISAPGATTTTYQPPRFPKAISGLNFVIPQEIFSGVLCLLLHHLIQQIQAPKVTSTSSPVNLSQNFQNQGFTALPGCLQFHRPTWTKEIKHICCNSDDLNDVKTWYEDLRSCLLSATGGNEVLPSIENLSSNYDFKTILLPPPHQANFSRAKKNFDSLSSALRILLKIVLLLSLLSTFIDPKNAV